MPRESRLLRIVTVALAACLALPAAAAEPADPDWPCVQRKVATLSVAQMWPGAPPDTPEAERAAAREFASLAQGLASRRVPVDQAVALAEDLVAGLEGEERARRLAALFDAIVARINVERGQVISGIGRYARRQAALADGVEAKRLELARLEGLPADQGDPARVAELRDTLAWDTRIFRERQQSLAYVCEAPALLERRAFELGRALGGLL